MKPNKKQLESIFYLFNDYEGKTHGEIAQNIWDYVEGELNKMEEIDKTHPLPERFVSPVMGSEDCDYKCRACGTMKDEHGWNQEITQNVTKLTCPECGAIHSEMIKGP